MSWDCAATFVQATLEQEDNKYVDHLLALGYSSAGVRPKILLHMENANWIIKFRSILDPKDISAIEYSYHLMAIKAEINVPEVKLFPSRKGLGFFGVKRFDQKDNKRIHMHSIAGLLHAVHREPSLDYEAIMKATLYLTHDVRECEMHFKNAVFNIFSHNRDDHSKNFSFLMDENGAWIVSPAYDLTFSYGPMGEHSTMFMGEGKNPKCEHLLKLAAIGNIKKDRALEIIDQVVAAIKQWTNFAKASGVSKLQTKNIGDFLDRLSKDIMQN